MPIKYKSMTFHGGEEHIVIDDPEIRYAKNARIFYNFSGSSSLIQLVMATDALKRMGVKNIELYCPYFPGARADRVDQETNPGEALGAKVYADLINAQGYERVFIFDAHSFVTPCLVHNCVTVSNHSFVQAVIAGENIAGNRVIVAPDAGANKKIDNLAKALGGTRVVRADKSRDVVTGALIPRSCKVFADTLEGQTCLIVDDICSKGGTFKPLATELRRLGAVDVYLVVSHDEGVSDHESLKEAGITKVITTNSRTTLKSTDFYKVYDVAAYLK